MYHKQRPHQNVQSREHQSRRVTHWGAMKFICQRLAVREPTIPHGTRNPIWWEKHWEGLLVCYHQLQKLMLQKGLSKSSYRMESFTSERPSTICFGPKSMLGIKPFGPFEPNKLYVNNRTQICIHLWAGQKKVKGWWVSEWVSDSSIYI